MHKAAARHGDTTTTRGVVLAFSSTIHDDGKKVALSGDEATCGNCEGIYKIFGTGRGMSEKGRDVVIDGDLVLCPCKRNRVIVGSNPGIFLETTQGRAVAGNAGETVVCAPALLSIDTFDEQVRAVAPDIVLDGYPYSVETADGQTFSGRMGASGLLSRVNTDEADYYTVHWGEEALVRREGA
ncbi:hypothetical protein PPGU19_043040 [Paraburkholderia sp. PGU19]|uniref:PAAR domain-containing protein n=1 Tax=Paraburkholderia sp. PGU19 TaxID=2735434 RepID=UPI0015DACB84|nr:PAAR domain-containing protein [Paraburkholderia sp. PGU19]BCF99735.1 hypothetical protein PPGU19_043040 [Paraburkholderia sp. PGU19]